MTQSQSPPSPTPFLASGSLSLTQRKQYKQLAQVLVQQAASQYLTMIYDDSCSSKPKERAVDLTLWKPVRRQDNFQVFKLREAPATATAQAKMLGVGTIDGTLEDAMYGASTPTELAMYTRSLYIEDQFVAHRVLHDIETPTEEAPFRYLGLKWAARASSVLSMIKPRDLVYLEASGFHNIRVKGGVERLGYTIYHSVDLQGMDTPATGMVRARMFLCVLYRDLGHDQVEVFATLTSEPGGSVPQRLAEISATDALTSIANISNSVLNKKLAKIVAQSGRDVSQYTTKKHRRRLRVPSFRSLTPCAICIKGCHPREILKRKLVLKPVADAPVYGTFPICDACTLTASKLTNAARLAWEVYADTSAQSSKTVVELMSSSRDLQEELLLMSMRVNVDALDVEDSDSESPKEPVCETLAAYQVRRDVRNTDAAVTERMVMIKQMQDLCVQAERTYRIARRQTLELHNHELSPVAGMSKPHTR